MLHPIHSEYVTVTNILLFWLFLCYATPQQRFIALFCRFCYIEISICMQHILRTICSYAFDPLRFINRNALFSSLHLYLNFPHFDLHSCGFLHFYLFLCVCVQCTFRHLRFNYILNRTLYYI